MMSAHSELNNQLRPHVAALKAAVAAGDFQAQQVVLWYQMSIMCPDDSNAKDVCRQAFGRWHDGLRHLRVPAGASPGIVGGRSQDELPHDRPPDLVDADADTEAADLPPH